MNSDHVNWCKTWQGESKKRKKKDKKNVIMCFINNVGYIFSKFCHETQRSRSILPRSITATLPCILPCTMLNFLRVVMTEVIFKHPDQPDIATTNQPIVHVWGVSTVFDGQWQLGNLFENNLYLAKPLMMLVAQKHTLAYSLRNNLLTEVKQKYLGVLFVTQ